MKYTLFLTTLGSLFLSTSSFALNCDIRVPPVIKLWTKGVVVERIEGRNDWTQVASGYSTTYTGYDSKYEASLEFIKLKKECFARIQEKYPQSIIYRHGSTFVSDTYYCSKPGVNGVYEALPRGNAEGNQYFIDIKRGEAIFDNGATKLKKCQKINRCIGASNDSIEIEDLVDLATKLKCPKGSIN